ncbi:MAG: pilus assembly protein [Candidatus Eremiobacteraeota bacterium]|nr:pilus assembly protein [Candidatus Eremiobacteraeota bacterium]
MRRQGQRGSVLVEFALVIPVAILLLFGIIEMANAVFAYDLVTNAARLGARYAIVRGSDCSVSGCPATSASIQTYVQGLSSGVNTASLTVTTTWSANGTCKTAPYQAAGCLVTVNVSYPYSLIMHPIVKSGWTMTSTSKMIISQ